MDTTIEKKVEGFLFPVTERAVYVDDDKTYRPTKHYKAIVREDNGKLVSIMKDSYQLVPNSTVILPLLEQLHTLDTNWVIDPSHSFEVIIQIDHVNPNIDMYYAEIILESGSRIAVKLGRPDDEGKFRIKNTFGKFGNISVYTDSNLEGE